MNQRSNEKGGRKVRVVSVETDGEEGGTIAGATRGGKSNGW